MEHVKSAWSSATQSWGTKRKRGSAEPPDHEAEYDSTTPKRARTNEQSAATEDVQRLDDGLNTPIRRKRGRPRKNQNGLGATPDDTKGSQNANGTESGSMSKRKRGRPRKSHGTSETPLQSTEDVENLDDKLETAKRKPGRPRKSNGVSETALDDLEDNDSPRSAHDGSEDVQAVNGAEQPRLKRWRPRKATATPEPAQSSAEEPESPDQLSEHPREAAGAGQVKRGRGRPRKSIGTPEQAHLVAEELSLLEQPRSGREDNEETPGSEKPKRKRGRPRKSIDPKESAPDTIENHDQAEQPLAGAEEDDVFEGAETPKRKRGRPRKIKDPLDLDHDVDEAKRPSVDAETPTKRKRGRPRKSEQPLERTENAQGAEAVDVTGSATPTKRKRGRPPGSKNKATLFRTIADGAHNEESPDPRIKARGLFATPEKRRVTFPDEETPPLVRNPDRSARRQSARALIERTMTGGLSDDEDQEEEDILAQRIWEEDEARHGDTADGSDREATKSSAPVTPIKRGPGRPKGSKRKRSPTPPQDLDYREQYFFQNRPGGVKTSSNTLSSLSLLTHEEYFSLIRNYIDSHDTERAYLEDLHSRSFDQWAFELSEGFNICLHGYGSKRHLVTEFARYLHNQSLPRHKIVIVNGHLSTFTIRDVLHTVANAALSPDDIAKLSGSQPADLLTSLLALLSAARPAPQVTLCINSIDSPALRRPNTQTLLSRLAAHQSIRLLATASHPNFPLLWDSSLRTAYNFLFHDCTTFRPPDASELDVVESVHELLGRSGRRVGGKEGVAFVLKSLPENARALYRVLVAEQLAGMLEQEDNLEDEEGAESGRRGLGNELDGSASAGVEFRVLYQKATEEFICGSEMAFRTLLKEFHDHQMIASRRDVLGGTGAGETLYAPFSKEELEGILEELVD
ncbi:MAG: hypothetical protein M4579_001809 [Chaenotheca gracillima]|nr:MAG: hypothetical protein M4579_001809 [Chaenotheca gracillima]